MTLIEVLKRHPHITAKQLARLMGAAIPTIYRRMKALRASGVRVSEFRQSGPGKTGPKPVYYSLVKS